ncbi:hypothetical protein LEP1GSC193_4176 [Leptospira alstonii serovar Pingchang str. 80-412]|uniref:Uncharacterized protein n=2 Tax=Leptospira alstonii TaxID=28452 RepID=M6CWB4_9LEPT|nr:hypothetical protein LEP1GSC194_1831 [Leptospira alstonii serovar Sichuan str. 79601]EQA78391.1 hypothetical protein LEP1GSC193_4176 [Leptospira alstonii serovar Pingchang str. 80-412]
MLLITHEGYTSDDFRRGPTLESKILSPFLRENLDFFQFGRFHNQPHKVEKDFEIRRIKKARFKWRVVRN